MMSPSSDTLDFCEKLAEAVLKYPCLNDKAVEDFSNRDRRSLAWNNATDAVGVDSGMF